jgi:hypothetical protein
MVKLKLPTGDPNMSRHICVAKRAIDALVKVTNGSTGTPGHDWDDDADAANEGEDEEPWMIIQMRRMMTYPAGRFILTMSVVMVEAGQV